MRYIARVLPSAHRSNISFRSLNIFTWVIALCCHAACTDGFNNIHMQVTDEDGKVVTVKVDKEFLDLADRQNSDFRYVF
ncbi:hypothetical protein BDV98DRAFT_565663 [Pterulicium gracile]|uniref:Uncharacterized protein n=1 Tax=Pterulicium gracile TaxID=1884261 RepID=A0A5C3QMD8_9AGAR|nr:hypothetical protein BDV98DRAFT_565663 [Pterula gracilis]